MPYKVGTGSSGAEADSLPSGEGVVGDAERRWQSTVDSLHELSRTRERSGPSSDSESQSKEASERAWNAVYFVWDSTRRYMA